MANQRQRSSRRRQRQSRRRLSGGDGGASGHGVAVFGAPGQQQSVDGGQTGVIAVAHSTGGGALSPAEFAGGGERGERGERVARL